MYIEQQQKSLISHIGINGVFYNLTTKYELAYIGKYLWATFAFYWDSTLALHINIYTQMTEH